MPVAVRNKEAGPTVFQDKDHMIEWGGAGTTEDIQMVPDELIDNINFMRSLNRGIFEIMGETASDEVKAKLSAQGLEYQERRDEAANNLESVMDRNTERPLVVGTVDEKGKVEVETVPRDPDTIPSTPDYDPNIYGPEEAEEPPAGAVVQMDEAGRPIPKPRQGESDPALDLKVTIGPTEKEV